MFLWATVYVVYIHLLAAAAAVYIRQRSAALTVDKAAFTDRQSIARWYVGVCFHALLLLSQTFTAQYTCILSVLCAARESF